MPPLPTAGGAPQATSALEEPGCAKSEEQAAGAAHILSVAALKYQQLDNVTGARQAEGFRV